MKIKSLYYNLFFVGFLLFSNSFFSQAPLNDNCAGAINIPLATPPPCGVGNQVGANTVVNGTNVNATPGNPYIYQTGCTGAAATMNFPANDVWYSFVATGYQCNITINSTFSTPNVAFYSGNCAALGGGIGGCAVGAGGVVTLTVTQLVPGTTYYLQISGATGQSGTFTMNINNSINCNNCLVNSNITVSPLPVAGAYPPNTTVQFCFHVGQYNTINTNWLHGVQLSFGSCWNPASLVTNIPTPAGAAGTWAYYPAGIGVQNAVNWTAGWYFDFNPPDGNPKNNFGDLPSGVVTAGMWNFCATLTSKAVCTPGCNLSVTFNTSGDGESGSWANNGCTNDPPAVFQAIGACCPPIMSSIPVKCFGTATGTAIATPVGAAGPYTYNWTGPAGYTATTVGAVGANTITNVVAGIYTVQVIDINLCSTTNTVQVTQPPVIVLVPASVNASCLLNGSASVVAAGGTPGYTYTWSPIGGNAANAPNLTPGTYTVTVADSKNCLQTATVNVILVGAVSPAFTTPTYTQCLTGNSFVFTALTAAGTHTFSFNPIAGSPASGFVTPYGPVSFTAPGTYTVTHTVSTGSCASTTNSVIVINPQPTVTANNNGPLCIGSNIVLTGGGGTTYSWTGPAGFVSALQSPTIVAATVVNAGVYTVTATLNGCTGTNTTLVSLTTPTASASNTGPYCAGTTIQLNTPAATSYTWSGPNVFNSNLQNPTLTNCTIAMAGTYTVLVTSGVCTSSATTNVVVNALPTPTANSNSPICVGQAINFTGLGGLNYSWSGPSGFISAIANPNIPIAAVTNSGPYTLTVTDINLCKNTVVTIVVVNPLPIIIVNNPTVCVNQTINLTANGGAGYLWNGPLAFTSILQNPNIANAVVGMTGVYNLTVTSAVGCTNTAVSNVSVFPLPNPAITSNTPCVGNTLNLTGSGGAVYGWLGPNNFISQSQNPNINLVTLAAAGVYTLLVSSGSCTASITGVISINPLPSPLIVSNSPVCIGMPINFTGSGGVSYSWSGPAGFTDATQNPTIAISALNNSGQYTLTVTDANNCVNSISSGVVVNPQPNVSATGTTVCENANANLSANGGVTYNWSGPGGYISISQNPIIIGATMAATGQYTVLVTDVNTCTNSAVANIIINPAPTPSIITNSPICINDILNLAVSGGVSYSWTGPGGFTSTSPNPTITATSVSVGGIYAVTATGIGGCIGSININTIVNPNPSANIIAGPNKGCAPLCVTFTCISSASLQSCDWNFGNGLTSTGPSNAGTCFNSTGIYSITASIVDVNGCRNSATYTAQVYPKPIADFNYHPYHPIVNDGITFTDASFNAAITGWNWYFISNAQYQSNLQNPTFIYTEAGEYPITLVVISDHGCKDTAIKLIIVGEDFGIFVPNAFTPNGDGLNDVFQPKGFGIIKYALRMFNRWGEELFYTEDFFHPWDGVYQGRLSQDDIYIWKINVVDVFSKAHEYTGHVTLIK